MKLYGEALEKKILMFLSTNGGAQYSRIRKISLMRQVSKQSVIGEELQ